MMIAPSFQLYLSGKSSCFFGDVCHLMRWSISGRARREFGGLNTFNTDPALEDSKRQTAEKPSG